MTNPDPQQDPTAEDPINPPTTQNRRRIPLLAAIALASGVGLVACLAGVAAGSGGKTTVRTAVSYAPTPDPIISTVIETVPAEPPSPTQPPPPPPSPTINEGSWTVGSDFPAGTYQSHQSDDSCYWAIYNPGANLGDIHGVVTNHNGGGNLRVTLKDGQGFETERCGTWSKIG